MTDEPYRSDGGVRCPTCHELLREVGPRWVCDTCHAMLLSVDEFRQTLAGAGALEIRVIDGEATRRACPHGDGPLFACEVDVGKTDALEGVIQHCPRHGLWMKVSVLEALLAYHGGRAHLEVGTARGHGGTMSGARNLDGLGLVGGFSTGGASAHGDYQLLKWWEKPRPTVHTAFVTTLADRRLACPICQTSLELRDMVWACKAHGVFVENHAFEAMVSDMIAQPFSLPPPAGIPGARACPACVTALVVGPLDGVELDRCAEHGLWFDPEELARVLAAEGTAAHPKTGWFHRLFGP